MITYAIIHNREVDKLDFSELMQDSINTCSKDNNGEYSIISFTGLPSFFEKVNFEYFEEKRFFNNNEIIALINRLENWITNDITLLNNAI
jgi:hypothetical protein